MSTLRVRSWVLVIAALAAVGCSKPAERKLAVYPVDGQFHVAGKPAVGVVVTFHPKLGESVTATTTATVRPDGHFVVTQPDGAIGLPEGTYRITAIWLDGDQDRLGGKYTDPVKAFPEVTVRPTINLLPLINVP